MARSSFPTAKRPLSENTPSKEAKKADVAAGTVEGWNMLGPHPRLQLSRIYTTCSEWAEKSWTPQVIIFLLTDVSNKGWGDG